MVEAIHVPAGHDRLTGEARILGWRDVLDNLISVVTLIMRVEVDEAKRAETIKA